jgi:group I intron endonuclease
MSILLYAKRIYFSPHTDKLVISLENLNQAGVYALICRVTNKVYIGSSIKLGARLLDYMQPAYLGSRPNSPLIKAIIKYGYINFCFTVLETCKPYEVLEREQYWLDLISPEYNLTPSAGSTLGVTLSKETRDKIRVARLGKALTLETRRLMSETRKGSNAYWYGKTFSDETKAKMSAAKQGALNPHFGQIRSPKTIKLMRTNHPHTKCVYQYDLDRLTLISQFDSIRQTAELTGISRSYLSRCLAEGTLAHGKWFFSYSAPSQV